MFKKLIKMAKRRLLLSNNQISNTEIYFQTTKNVLTINHNIPFTASSNIPTYISDNYKMPCHNKIDFKNINSVNDIDNYQYNDIKNYYDYINLHYERLDKLKNYIKQFI